MSTKPLTTNAPPSCLVLWWGYEAEVESELFEKHEGQNGLRTKPDEGGNVPLEEPKGAQFRRVCYQVPGASELPGFGVHRTGLEYVQWLSHCSSYCSLEKDI